MRILKNWLRATSKVLVLVSVSYSIQATAAESVNLGGFVSLWDRECVRDNCQIPRAVTEKVPVKVKLDKPDSGITLANREFELGEHTLKMTFIYKIDSPNYLIVQSSLTKGGARVLACSQYHAVKDGWFPSGFCSAMISKTKELGISFYKNY